MYTIRVAALDPQNVKELDESTAVQRYLFGDERCPPSIDSTTEVGAQPWRQEEHSYSAWALGWTGSASAVLPSLHKKRQDSEAKIQ